MRSAATRPVLAALCLVIAAAVSACSEKAHNGAPVAQAPAPETVYVRQPEPAPPPPEPLAVAPRSLLFDAIGDTARMSIPDGAQCVAASANVASIDEGGLVTAVANGETHLRCWGNGQNASVKVKVAQALARVEVVAENGLELRKSGDSLQLSLNRVDRRGTPVEGLRPSWLSLAPEVVRVDAATGTAVGVADSGIARIVGNVDGFADTVIVEVGAKADALLSVTGRSSLSRSRAASRANQRLGAQRLPGAAGPGIVTQSVTTGGAVQQQNPLGIGVRSPRPSDSLFVDPSLGGTGRRPRYLVPYLTAALEDYRVDQPPSAGGLGLEKNSGTLFGGGLDLTTHGLLSFRFQFLTGTLASDSVNNGDRKLTEGSLDAGLQIAPWMTVLAGAQVRRWETTTPPSVTRWLMLRAGGDATFNLGGGPLRGIARVFILPLVSLASDQASVKGPSFGIQANFGLGFENRRISSSLLYDIERYSYQSTVNKREQIGALLFRIGYKFGW